MSIDNIYQLEFPLQEEIPSAEVLILRDIDVVGVGSLRRHQIEELQKTKKFILHTYERIIPDSVHGIYSAEILRTLQWLRPVQTMPGPEFNFFEEQKKTFAHLFPRTLNTLGLAAGRMMEVYLQEMEWSSWLLQDHWRYFVGFLRSKFPENKVLLELAHWEWGRAWIEVQPFEGHNLGGSVQVNPSLQIINLSTANPILSRDEGVYAFVYDEEAATVVEKRLDVYEAQILDLLHEDRKFTKQQLIEMALVSDEIDTPLSAKEWEKKFQGLCQHAILIAELHLPPTLGTEKK